MKLTALTLLLGLVAIPSFSTGETLFNSTHDNGGFGALVVKATSFTGRTDMMTGARAGWIVNHSFIIGGGLYMLTSTSTAPSLARTNFENRKLKLKVNEAKSSVTQPGYTKYLGFGFTISKTNPRIRIHSKSLKRFRERVLEITVRTRGRSINQVITELNAYIRGWWGYFSPCEARTCLRALNAWVIRRLRAYIWKQWKLPRTKVRALINGGVPEYWAVRVGTTRKGPWRLSRNTTVAKALPASYSTRRLGLVLAG